MISDDERVMVQISTYPMDESALSCFSFVAIRKPAALCEFGEKEDRVRMVPDNRGIHTGDWFIPRNVRAASAYWTGA